MIRSFVHRWMIAASVRWLALAITAALALGGAVPFAQGAALPGTGQLSGRVTAAPALGQLTVYAMNTDRSVGYMVYVVDGRYRFVDLFPGHYEVSVRGASGQLNMSLPEKLTSLELAPGQHARASFTLGETQLPPTYVGGLPYPDTRIEPYDAIYPPGPGRDLIERTCFGCHTIQVYPYNVVRDYPGGRPLHDHEGWAITVDRMEHGLPLNTAGKAPYFDATLLPEGDAKTLVDYLASNFGVDSIPRSVRQETQPELDKAALAKAEFIEYRFLNKPDESRFTHTIDFDPTNGNVFVMDRGAASIVEVNPETGERKDHIGQGGGEFLQVDVDGTVWYGGLGHLDPKTGLFDTYRTVSGKPLFVSSMAIDYQGELWLSMLFKGAIGKWDRKTDTITWWDVPVLRSRPYGISLDHDDKVWFAEYHNSGIASFDPTTQKFRHYPVTKTPRPTSGAPMRTRRTSCGSPLGLTRTRRRVARCIA